MKSKEQLKQKFNQLNVVRINQTVRLTSELNELVGFMQHTIKKEFQNFNLFSFTICSSGGRNFKIPAEFEAAFKGCQVGQQVGYYEVFVNYITDVEKQTSIKAFQQQLEIEELTIKIIKGLKIKEPIKIRIQRLTLDCKNYQIDLNTYLLRKSKKEGNIFLFDTLTQQQPATIRLEIMEPSPLKTHTLIEVGKRCFKQYLGKLNKKEDKATSHREIKLSKKAKAVEFKPIAGNENAKLISQVQLKGNGVAENHNKSLMEELLVQNSPGNFNQEIYQFLQRRESEIQSSHRKHTANKLHKNQLSILLPQYNIESIQIYHDFVIHQKNQNKKLFIYYSQKYDSYKLQLILNSDCQKVVSQLCEGQNEKLWNRSINESQVKWAISSQNATIFYRKQKSLSQWYRQRDFIFIKYLFKKDNRFYIIDRSIEDTYFIPFQSIHRGHIKHCISRIEPFANQTSKLIMEISVQYGGMLTNEQKKELTLSYLREYINLQSFVENFKSKTKNMYDLNWEIEDSPYEPSSQSLMTLNSQIFQQDIEPLDDFEQQSFYSIKEETERVEITAQQKLLSKIHQVKEYINEEIKLNEEGFSILPKLYLKVRHPTVPIKVNESRKKIPYENIMLKNDFVVDKEGGMLLVNQARIAAQNNVLKFIMATLKKNLFSGKGILNISLPVQIFNSDSNLQRLCESAALAPQLIQKKAVAANPLQRFKNCIAFALSNSILYFDIDKAFNPILGQTYQGLIDGCPVYGEQISHHPPISSILFYGRGYKIYANIQAKVYVHLNSGEGVNEGLYTIQFDDGGKVMFQTAPGQISGLAVGDRKYRIKGKMIVIDPKNKLCSCISFQEETGLFAAKKWKFSDQMEGEIVRVTDGYIRNFFGTQVGKEIKGPTKKEIQQSLCKVQGRWVDKLVIDGKIFYDIKWLPYEMIHYQFPLNSNSNYREDLIYRKMNNLARSQQEKERLEVFQRNDRKLRQKYHPNKH